MILPSETVYGVFARADLPAATTRLTALLQEPSPGSWHAPTAKRVIETFRPALRAHRRAIRKLMPGPITLLLTPEQAPAGLPLGVLDREGEFRVRVPDYPLLQRILEGGHGPIVGNPIGDAGVGAESEITPESIGSLQDAGVSLALDDGSTRERQRATLVRLGDGPTPEIVAKGAMDERTIHGKIRRRIVFVCTGNTCRSPMGEAIARSLVAGETEPLETEIVSVGISAGTGSGATPEAIEALGERGYELTGHQSKGLSLELLAGADAIYTMTEAHLRGVLSLDPFAPAERLDIAGDIPDPIGGPLSEYRECAERIAGAIERRLKELDP